KDALFTAPGDARRSPVLRNEIANNCPCDTYHQRPTDHISPLLSELLGARDATTLTGLRRAWANVALKRSRGVCLARSASLMSRRSPLRNFAGWVLSQNAYARSAASTGENLLMKSRFHSRSHTLVALTSCRSTSLAAPCSFQVV